MTDSGENKRTREEELQESNKQLCIDPTLGMAMQFPVMIAQAPPSTFSMMAIPGQLCPKNQLCPTASETIPSTCACDLAHNIQELVPTPEHHLLNGGKLIRATMADKAVFPHDVSYPSNQVFNTLGAQAVLEGTLLAAHVCEDWLKRGVCTKWEKCVGLHLFETPEVKRFGFQAEPLPPRPFPYRTTRNSMCPNWLAAANNQTLSTFSCSCSYAHNSEELRPINTHILYPEGNYIKVQDPKGESFNTYPSSQVFMTIGSSRFYEALFAGNPEPLAVSCYHYWKTGKCSKWDSCTYIHILDPTNPNCKNSFVYDFPPEPETHEPPPMPQPTHGFGGFPIIPPITKPKAALCTRRGCTGQGCERAHNMDELEETVCLTRMWPGFTVKLKTQGHFDAQEYKSAQIYESMGAHEAGRSYLISGGQDQVIRTHCQNWLTHNKCPYGMGCWYIHVAKNPELLEGENHIPIPTQEELMIPLPEPPNRRRPLATTRGRYGATPPWEAWSGNMSANYAGFNYAGFPGVAGTGLGGFPVPSGFPSPAGYQATPAGFTPFPTFGAFPQPGQEYAYPGMAGMMPGQWPAMDPATLAAQQVAMGFSPDQQQPQQ